MMSLFNRSKENTDESKSSKSQDSELVWEIIEENDEQHKQLDVDSPDPYFIFEGELLKKFVGSDVEIDTGDVWEPAIKNIIRNHEGHIYAYVQINGNFTIDIKQIHVDDLNNDLVYKISNNFNKMDLGFDPLGEDGSESITIRCH